MYELAKNLLASKLKKIKKELLSLYHEDLLQEF